MNDEERRIITEFVTRIAGATNAARPGGPQGSPWGSVPNTQAAPPLPPVDREADMLIADLFARHPEARYRLTQAAFVQEAAIIEMQNRIRQLEWEVENAQRQGQAQAAQQKGGGGLFGMFGGGGARPPQPAPMPPPPQPQYPPQYNPQMLQPQRGGMGFFGTALAGAAGVAGGMMLGNALMGAFGGSHGAAQAATPASSPWSDPASHASAQGWGTEGDAKSDWGGGGSDKFADGGASQPGWGSDGGNYTDQGDSTPANWGGGDDGGYDNGGSDEEI